MRASESPQAGDAGTARPLRDFARDDADPDPAALPRSPRYVRLLVLAAVLGVPISAVAYGFLALVGFLQRWIYDDLPSALGYAATTSGGAAHHQGAAA